ncbi:MAG: FG-GAP-like repeat-containing protein [Bacteroidota bacterium]
MYSYNNGIRAFYTGLLLIWSAVFAGSSQAADKPGKLIKPLAPKAAQAITFTSYTTGLPSVANGTLVYGDRDNDGDLDVLITGQATDGTITTAIYDNDGNGNYSATTLLNGLTAVCSSAAAWGDYDRDGDLDIAVSGRSGTGVYSTKIYRNDGATFSGNASALTGMYLGTVSWADYDNDGDLDLFVSGVSNNGENTVSAVLYRNTGGSFASVTSGITALFYCQSAWGDFDNDGDLDLAYQGKTATTATKTTIYKNTSGVFTDLAPATLTGACRGSLAWGDYDSDGDLDLLQTGSTDGGIAVNSAVTKIYTNDGTGTFSTNASSLAGYSYATAVWGDYDNDGDLDFAVGGLNTSTSPTTRSGKIYNNNAGAFSEVSLGFASASWASVAFGDPDKDGDLDLLTSHSTGGGTLQYSTAVTTIYKNAGVTSANTKPSTPVLTIVQTGIDTIKVTWTKATDSQTPQNGLSYSLRIGTTPGGSEIVSAHSNAGTGYRLVAAPGQFQYNANGYKFYGINGGKYYASIQAIDGSLAGSTPSSEISFNEVDFTLATGTNLPALYRGSSAWGDYDNDGDLDLVMTGTSSASVVTSSIYNNNGSGVFSLSSLSGVLTPVCSSAVAWGDYDNDGDLDLLMNGTTAEASAGTCVSKLYRNDGSAFIDASAGFTGLSNGAANFVDYDNDGDLDVFLSGHTSDNTTAANASILYTNNGGVFTNANANILALGWSAAAWADYDKDGDQDLAISGYNNTSGYRTSVYKNTLGTFTLVTTGMTGVDRGSISWGDYDADGDQDLLVTGTTDGNPLGALTRIYSNDGGTFTNINATVQNLGYSSASWGDIDNDGDLDVLMEGVFSASNTRVARLYRNDAGSFTNYSPVISGGSYPSATFADYDNDNDLDILITGTTANTAGTAFTKLYRNDYGTANTAPSVPTGLTVTSPRYGRAVFTWNKSTDTETAQNAITYNLRIGTGAAGVQALSPMADLSTGFRKITAYGPQLWTSGGDTVTLPAGTYYYSIQAIDAAGKGSAFSSTGSFNVYTFADVSTGIPNLYMGTSSWADYDSDGDLDLLAGGLNGTTAVSTVYKNTGGTFSDAGAGLTGFYNGTAAFGDYDNDGDQDLLLTGNTSSTTWATTLYRNTAGTFTDASAGLTGMYQSVAAWGDYDNDGDQDLLISGLTGANTVSSGATVLYKNTAGVFSVVNAGLANLSYSAAAWGDYDNDGDQDLVISGYNNAAGAYNTNLYNNNGGAFSLVAQLTGVNRGTLSWGDYDADGDIDLLLCGTTNGNNNAGITKVYRNDAGTLTDINATLTGYGFAAAAWADFDGDGDLDFAVSGVSPAVSRGTKLYRNDAGTFNDASSGLAGGSYATLSWGDYNNDNTPDLYLSGTTSAGTSAGANSHLYKPSGFAVNTVPGTPNGLSVNVTGHSVDLNWNKPSDAQTASAGLAYSLKVGTSGNKNKLVSGNANASGYRQIAALGKFSNATASLSDVPPGTYAWSVRAVDNSLAAGSFSTEGSFSISNHLPEANTIANTSICSFAGLQTITVNGISDGDEFTQTLTITATSSNHSVLADPSVVYTQGESSLDLQLNPVFGRFGSSTVTLVIDDNYGGSSITRTFTVNVTAPVVSIWTGEVSSDWSNAGNWNCQPLTTTNIEIPATDGFAPVVTSSQTFTMANLSVTGLLTVNGTLVVNGNFSNSGTTAIAASANFSVKGNFANTGSFNPATGNTVTLNGTSGQTITGSTAFYNLAVSNSGSGRVTNASGSTVRVINTFSLPAGGKYTNSGSTVLASSAAGTARLGVLSDAAQYAGNLTTERYVSPDLIQIIGTNVMVGSPFTNTTLASFQTPLNQMFGFPGAEGEGGRPGASSVWLYNPLSADSNSGWVKPNGITEAMTPGKGARVFFSGRFMTQSNVYSLTGTLPASTTYNLPLQYCTSGCAVGYTPNGFNLVANPLPSEISWESAAWTKTNIAGAIYIWQQKNKRYSVFTYDPNVGPSSAESVNGGSGIIPSGQGFFVQATGASNELTATEGVKITGSTPYAGLQRNASAGYRLKLGITAPSGFSNEAIVALRNDATRGFDAAIDAYLFASGGGADIATMPVPGKFLSVNKMPITQGMDTLAVYVNSSVKGAHTLNITGLDEMFADGYRVYLRDNYLHSLSDMNLYPVRNFNITADAASKGSKRFVLIFLPQDVTGLQSADAGLHFEVMPNPGRAEEMNLSLNGFGKGAVQIRVTDMLGRIVAERTLETAQGGFSGALGLTLKAGVYNISAVEGNRRVMRKVVIN